MMLSHHLQSALKDLRDLIAISQKDIDDIQKAAHDNQFERLSIKEEYLKSFESKKAMIDHEISKKMSANPEKELSELLNEIEHKELENLKFELSALRDINQRYAKMVLSVGSFYNSLLEQVVPTEMQGYKKVASSDSTFLKVRV
jgi:glutamyl-tRNA reductase